MKRTLIIIVLASFAFSFVWWKLNGNKTFSIIFMFVGFVAGMIQIFEFLIKKDIVSIREKEIAEKERSWHNN